MNEEKRSIMIVAATPLADQIIENIGHHDMLDTITDPANHDNLIDRVQERAPHIVILDSDLPGFDWITTVHRLKSSISVLPIIVLAASHKKSSVLSAFREGADAFLLIKSLPKQLVSALDAVKKGIVYFSQDLFQLIRDHMLFLELGSAKNVAKIQNGIAKLTTREKEVFVLLADGKSIKDSAAVLGLSPKTVETHKYHIMEKLDFETLADFTKLAMIKDLIPL